jgi:heme/copper-type cytochrome/quinol oxidase subunit 2
MPAPEARQSKWQTSSSTSCPGLNRIRRVLGHLLLATQAFFTPESGGSPNADNIDSLYKIVLVVALIIFVLVIGGLGYTLVKFRARKGATALQIHGHTRLEIGWTSAAAVILVGLAILTFVRLGAIQNPPNSDASSGIYRGQCALICGRGHARMIATVKAVPPAQFEAWLAYQKKLIAEANADAAIARAKLNSQTGAGQVENP